MNSGVKRMRARVMRLGMVRCVLEFTVEAILGCYLNTVSPETKAPVLPGLLAGEQEHFSEVGRLVWPQRHQSWSLHQPIIVHFL